jgi:hypothetical protein
VSGVVVTVDGTLLAFVLVLVFIVGLFWLIASMFKGMP